jgi:dolichyl-phosphate beta-glucosyltransferase
VPPPARPIDLSVVVPAFNEADRLGSSVQRVRDYLTGRDVRFEIVLVNDGSTDGTGALMAELAKLMPEVRVIDLERNRGKGRAVREGVLASRGDRVLITDADLSTPIEELPKLERALEVGVDVASGSRFATGARIELAQPPHRVVMGRVFSAVVRLLLLRGVRDTQCGFKLLRADVARRVFTDLRIDRFAYDVELLYRCRMQGAHIAEVPVRWLHSGRSSVAPLRDSAAMLRDVLLLRTRL